MVKTPSNVTEYGMCDQSPNRNDATSNDGLRGENGGRQSFVEPTVTEMRVRLE